MKIGWLVVNSFLKSEKFEEIYAFLVNEGKKYDITLIKKTSSEILLEMKTLEFVSYEENPEFILFWDKDFYLARLLEEKGYKLFNNATAILNCDDKALTSLILSENKIPQPKTIPAPKSFKKIDDFAFLDKVIAYFSFPFIIKEVNGSFGNEVYLINNKDEAISVIKKIENRPFLFQEFIKESKGKTIRVNVVGEKVVASMLFENNEDFRSNFARGSRVSSYKLSKEEKEIALKAFNALKLDFAGIDILQSKNGPLICEVNSNAQFKATYECTLVNIAEKIMEHINTYLINK